MKKNNKGFTLAELLIVVAIIAVLVAIAIPVFTTQLEKSREAVDFSNARAAYAEMMAAALTNDKKVTANYNGTATAIWNGSAFSVEVKPLKQAQDGWATDITDIEIGGIKSTAWTGTPKANGSCTITYTPAASGDGAVTIAWG